MDIDTIGEKTCEQLLEAGYIQNVADFYHLTRDQLLAMEGVKEKSADNMLKAIEASKHRSLSRLLFGLNIRYVGEKTAQILAGHFLTMNNLQGASEEEIVKIPGIGPKIGHSVYLWLQEPVNRALVEQLREAGVTMEEEQKQKKDGPLSGQTFLLTGRLNNMTRSAAEEAIVNLGGTIASGVSKSLSHLIVGEDAGSKLAKAQKAGVPVHDEQWLVDLLEQHKQ
jgi:DNA ligase (NAD+)